MTQVQTGPLALDTHLHPPIVHCLKHTLGETYGHGLPTPEYALRSQRSAGASAVASGAVELLKSEEHCTNAEPKSAASVTTGKTRRAIVCMHTI